MNKKKKIIVIIIIAIVALLLITGLIYFIVLNNTTNVSKVNKLYLELKEKPKYSFTTTLNEENKTFYAKKDNTAYINTIYDGEESKFIIKDGNTHLLVDEDKRYYTYANNETDLEKITLILEEIKDLPFTEGKEEIDNKQYKFEEYDTATGFLVKAISDTEELIAKTRFYFNGNKLVYIKIIVGNYEELLKVSISNNVDENLFEIPADYEGF